jgi:hypothetical protein
MGTSRLDYEGNRVEEEARLVLRDLLLGYKVDLIEVSDYLPGKFKRQNIPHR